jgi:hypothetical protein
LGKGDQIGILKSDEEKRNKIIDDGLHDVAYEAGEDRRFVAWFHENVSVLF